MITIDREKCTNCEKCYKVCSDLVFDLNPDQGKERVLVKYPELCCFCRHCVSICPEGAISHDDFFARDLKELPGVNISSEDMENLMLSRRSIRDYKTDKVPEEIIQQLLDAAVNAGTAGNMQLEDFIVIQDQNFLKKLEKEIFRLLWKGIRNFKGNGPIVKIISKIYGETIMKKFRIYYLNFKHRIEDDKIDGMVFRNAPLVIVIHGLKKFYLGQTNAALAARNIELLAKTLGLGTCWSGFLVNIAHLEQKKINKMLNLDNSRKVYAALMIGYPAHDYKHMIPRKSRDVRWI